MITRAKNYTNKTKQNKTKWTVRTLGQMVKTKLYRQNHRKKSIHTHSQKEKKAKIYICTKKKKEESNLINKQIFQS